MKRLKKLGWIFYYKQENAIKDKDIGKWMYFFDDKKFVAKICRDAVENNIVSQAKYSDAENGVACFYINGDDIEAHKRVLNYFMENNLIKRTKVGKLYNISFKLDAQTLAGSYGDGFKATIKLEDFIDLETGKWIR